MAGDSHQDDKPSSPKKPAVDLVVRLAWGPSDSYVARAGQGTAASETLDVDVDKALGSLRTGATAFSREIGADDDIPEPGAPGTASSVGEDLFRKLFRESMHAPYTLARDVA